MTTRRQKANAIEALQQYRAQGHYPSDGSVSYPSSRRRRPTPRPDDRVSFGAVVSQYVHAALFSDDAAAFAGVVAITSICAGAAMIYFNAVGAPF